MGRSSQFSSPAIKDRIMVEDNQSSQLYKREQKFRRFMGDTVSSHLSKVETALNPNQDLLHD